jgi:tetratricopeptide (TPR) repeat protein
MAAAIVMWQLPAAAGDPAVAREQLKIGYTLAQEGKCDEAIPHLVESLRLDPKAITLINLADCEEKVGKLSDAMAHWGDARSRAQADGQKPIEDEAMTRASALEPRLARLTIVLAPSAPKDAVVERDGVVLGPPSMGIPLPVDPGPHAIVVKAKGRPDGTTQLTLAEGEAKRVEVDAGGAPIASVPREPDAPTGRSVSPLVFIGFGVAAAGIGAGTITGLMAMSAGDDAKTACPNRVCDQQQKLDDIDSGRTLGLVSTISFAVAGAGAAVGVYGLLWGGGKKTPKPDPSVGVSLGPTGFALRGRF